MIEYQREEQLEMIQARGFLVKVIGVGGAGSNVLDQIALDGMEDAELVCTNTDVRTLKTSTAHAKVQIGKQLTRGLGAGGDPELGILAAEEAETEIRQLLRNQNMVFICVGLGGGTGSGAAPTISRIAKEEGAFVVVFATMPFSFEGRRRIQQAETALKLLERSSDALVTFENDRMGELVLPKEGIQQAFANADRIISQSVRAITNVVNQPGLIQIGMDDLLTALKNPVSRCLFGYGIANGKNRAQEALKMALKSPLLDRGLLLERSRNALVHVVGGSSMSLFEVEALMSDMSKHVGHETQVLFGAAVDEKMDDNLSVTIISSLSLDELRAYQSSSGELAGPGRESRSSREESALKSFAPPAKPALVEEPRSSFLPPPRETPTPSKEAKKTAPPTEAVRHSPQATPIPNELTPPPTAQVEEPAALPGRARSQEEASDSRDYLDLELDEIYGTESVKTSRDGKSRLEMPQARPLEPEKGNSAQDEGERLAREAAERKAEAEHKAAEERERLEAEAREREEEAIRQAAFERRREELRRQQAARTDDPAGRPTAEDLMAQRRRAQEELERKRAELERLLRMEDQARKTRKKPEATDPVLPEERPTPSEAHHESISQPAPLPDLEQTQRVSAVPSQRIAPVQSLQPPLPPPARPLTPKPVEPPKATTPETKTARTNLQSELQLDPVRGRFEKGTPTVMDGENLDVPTFFRKRGKKG